MSPSQANVREENGPYRLIHDVYVLLDYGDRLVLEGFGLTSTQFRLLNLIDSNKGQRLTTLSDRLLRSKSQLTRVVDALEENGLVERTIDPQDRRAQHVVLTKSGQTLREQVNREHQKSLEARLGVLDADQQQTLVNALNKLKYGMSKYLALE